MKLLFKKTKIIFLMILAASFSGCEEDDEGNALPEVLAAFTQLTSEDSGTVSFINTSENADSYEWDFGDGTTSTEVDPIKTYVTGTYTVSLTASNAAGGSDTFEDELVIVVPEQVMLPITFDGANVDYDPTAFGGTSFEIVDNPAPGGSNDSASKVGAITNSGTEWEGIFFDLGEDINLTTNKTIQMNFWADAPVDVLVKLEEGTGADTELTVSHGGSGWELIAFDFTSSDSFPRLTMFVDGPGTTAGTFYMDDIEQVETATTPSGCVDAEIAATAVPVDFEGCETFLSSENFGSGITSAIVENPFKTGINTSDFVLQVDKPTGSDFFAGIQNTFASNFDLTTTDVFKLKVYSTKANVVFRFELALNPQTVPVTGNPAPVFVTIPNANEWTEVEVTFTGLPGGPTAYNQLVIKPDNDMADSAITDGGTYYIDDLILDTAGGGSSFDDGLLTNGDFEDGGNSWIGNALNVVTDSGNSFNQADVTAAGNAFDVNLSQVVEITQGTDYILTFDASSDRSRTILAGIGLNEAPFTNTNQSVSLTTDTQTFVLNLSATDFGGANSRILFDMGAEVGVVVIDNVRLEEDTTGGGSFDSGLLTNGDFESGSAPWILGVDDSAAAPVTTDSGNSFYSVNVTTPDPGQPFLVNLSQKLEITPDATYTLTFDAWSDTNRSIIAGIGLSGGSFANTTETIAINTTRQTYMATLTATGFGDATSRVLFDLNGEAGLVNIDNVSLVLDSSGGGDTEAPVITLSGDATVNLSLGDPSYVDAGATANDNVDGDITANIVVGGDTVDTNVEATYTITYNVSDAAGNAATQVTRTVIVTDNSFDDGLLTNGDFENGSAPWILGVDDGAAAPITTDSGNSFYSVNVTTPDPGQPFLVNLSQKLEITPDATYTLTFDAWSDTNRSIIAGIGLSGGSFANTTETIAINTTRQTYMATLTATGFGDATSRVLFDLNGEAGLVNIDNVSLVLDSGGSGGGPTALSSLPADFEGGEEFSAVFEPASVNGSITTNTVSGGINTSANIYTFNKPSGTEFYGGMENVFASALDMTTTRTFKVKVYSTKANAVFQFELQSRPNDGSIPNYSIQQTVVNANEWVELTFDFGAIVPVDFNPSIYNAIVIIPDFDPGNNPTSTTETYYVDDIILE
ncbi:carbohydrate binding domain-containing protein [Flagellimonas sp.]|uniref:carbohydrate binding domain-containing protein n=1 Tax=Flagellimonas sp. TaxID=2058762 RepID=UPI003B5153D7